MQELDHFFSGMFGIKTIKPEFGRENKWKPSIAALLSLGRDNQYALRGELIKIK